MNNNTRIGNKTRPFKKIMSKMPVGIPSTSTKPSGNNVAIGIPFPSGNNTHLSVQPKTQPFKITESDPNITADATFGTTWRDTWTFKCPPHMKILLRNGDKFSCKVYDSADVEYVAPDAQVRIEVRDPSGNRILRVFGENNYVSCSEFQQLSKKAKLRLKTSSPILVNARDKIVIMTKDSTGMDAASIANSFFALETSRILD